MPPLNRTCTCGHVEDEHGHDPKYPGSSACNIDGCDCIAFEWDGEEEEDDDREVKLERTRRGLCARCGEGPSKHPHGNCPDGRGSYTWAQTGEDLKRTIDNLEAILGKRRRPS